MPQKFYLTTPIYYVNARPHIGHAYTTIVADVLARRHRLLGDDTWFLTGTDEHGQKIERSALAAGVPPQQFADQVSRSFRDLWDRMGLTYDQYIRTTDEAHKRGVQKLFTTLQEKGAIYLDSYTGAYCVSDEAFVDAPVGTPCPDCGRITETVTEENYFFKLSEYQLPLLNVIESGELTIEPEARKNEVLSFLRGNVAGVVTEVSDREVPGPSNPVEVAVKEGKLAKSAALQNYVPGAVRDLSISRSSFTWGIPVPKPTDPGAPGLAPETWAGAAQPTAQDHVIYVWLDALANYMTAVGYGDESPEGRAKFERYWPADLHIVGKEIIRFHCVYWPAFLLAAEIALPKKVVAHGWLLFDDSKMSKSKGNIVRTETILDAFGTLKPDVPKSEQDLFAADILRYFLLREIPFGQDGSFSFDALITRYNADLANGYGNLVSRTLTMQQSSQQNFEVFDERMRWNEKDWLRHAHSNSQNVFTWSDPNKQSLHSEQSSHDSQFDVIEHAIRTRDLFAGSFGNVGFQALLAEVNLTISITDKFLSREAPWKLAKQDSPEAKQKLAEVLYTAAESIRIITALLYPILPYATASVWRQLGLGDIEQAAKNGDLRDLKWGGLKPGTKLGPLSPIFPRADKGLAKIMADMELPKITTNADATHPASDDLPTAPVASKLTDEAFAQSPTPVDPTHPAAPPRTGSFTEPTPGLQVAGSSAATTERTGTPSHTEAASGIFAGQSSSQPETPQITIDDFIKIDLRVAKIIVAERIPKADKLLRLEVDLGYETRQILSGIAEHYTPEELIGRRIVVIANLAPRKMRGLESHGMLLAASAEGGKPILATFPEVEELPLGSRLK